MLEGPWANLLLLVLSFLKSLKTVPISSSVTLKMDHVTGS